MLGQGQETPENTVLTCQKDFSYRLVMWKDKFGSEMTMRSLKEITQFVNPEDWQEFTKYLKERPGVKATLYTLLIRRNVIGCGYGAAVAGRIWGSFLPYHLQGKPKRKDILGYKRPPRSKGVSPGIQEYSFLSFKPSICFGKGTETSESFFPWNPYFFSWKREELNYRKRTFFTEVVTAKTRTLLLLGSAGKRKKPGRLGS